MALQTTAFIMPNLTDFYFAVKQTAKKDFVPYKDGRGYTAQKVNKFNYQLRDCGLFKRQCGRRVYCHNNRTGQNNNEKKLKMSFVGRHLKWNTKKYIIVAYHYIKLLFKDPCNNYMASQSVPIINQLT